MSSTDRVLRSHSAYATRSRSVSDFQLSLYQDPALATWTPAAMTSPTAATTSQAAAEDRALERAVEKASASNIVLPILNLYVCMYVCM
jgi:uncharacterized protein with WD repeat